ncbi:MAG: hypothetical protein JWO20_2805, partial [Candidatus Angelobacter sp.]|nr:hypothetical protein [Candidatus Angelobacter sp.]
LSCACTSKPPPTLHVKAVTPCADSIGGTFEGVEYALAPVRGDKQLGIACYDPIRIEDISKDFSAHLDAERGVMIINVQGHGAVTYSIQSAREVSK